MITLQAVHRPLFSSPLAIFEHDGIRQGFRLGEKPYGFSIQEVSESTSGLSGYVVLEDLSGDLLVVETGDQLYPEDYQ